MVSSLVGRPRRSSNRSPGRPPVMWPIALITSATRHVRRARGAAISGSCSEKVCFSHSALPHRHRLIWTFSVTATPWLGRSWNPRRCQLCRLVDRSPQPGQTPDCCPIAVIRQASSVRSALMTRIAGPGAQSCFLCMRETCRRRRANPLIKHPGTSYETDPRDAHGWTKSWQRQGRHRPRGRQRWQDSSRRCRSVSLSTN